MMSLQKSIVWNHSEVYTLSLRLMRGSTSTIIHEPALPSALSLPVVTWYCALPTAHKRQHYTILSSPAHTVTKSFTSASLNGLISSVSFVMSLFSVFSQFYAWIFTQTRPWKKYFPVISHIKELEELKTSNLFLLHIDNILTIFYLS